MDRKPIAPTPPHCPNPECESRTGSRPWRYKRKGFYVRRTQPHRIQRYRCQHCGRSFSSQTFLPSYWMRRPELLVPLFHRLVGCSGFRQIAREMGVSHGCIQRMTERLGRHCLLYHERLRPKGPPSEPLVLDGFRTFEHSQYWPFDLNLLVGPSHYVYGFNDAELRRSGTMRAAQRQKRHALEHRHGRPDPQATRKAVGELVARVVPPNGSAQILSDEHQAYPRALQRLVDRVIEHATTSSKAIRTPQNPLFPVNHADLLLRHSSANHKRETIAFSKRRQSALYRAAIWVVWRNYMKARSEKRRDGPPARLLGLIRKPQRAEAILARRHFPDALEVGSWLWRCYFGLIPTRRLERCRSHRRRYAV